MKFITKIIQSIALKRFLLLFFLLVLFIVMSAFSYVNAITSDIANNLFRLHVIANSDSTEDQNLKFIVRDAIIQYINKESQDAESKEEVLLFAQNNIEQIKNIAQDYVYANGYTYNVNVEIDNLKFPTKYYGDIRFPSGYYDALKVKIGEAEGENWWCVMFPPLCFIDVSSGVVPDSSKEVLKDNLLDEEYKLLSDNSLDMQIKFKVVEVFQSISSRI